MRPEGTHSTDPPPTSSAQKRRRWTIAITSVFIIVAGWLYFAPPLISYGTDNPVPCRPLGASLLYGGMTLGGVPSYAPSSHGVTEYMETWAIDSTPEEWSGAEAGITDACSHARTNQQTTLFVVVTGGIAALLGLILRRQTLLLQHIGTGDARADADPG